MVRITVMSPLKSSDPIAKMQSYFSDEYIIIILIIIMCQYSIVKHVHTCIFLRGHLWDWIEGRLLRQGDLLI